MLRTILIAVAALVVLFVILLVLGVFEAAEEVGEGVEGEAIEAPAEDGAVVEEDAEGEVAD